MIFVSYAREDETRVKKLVAALERRGLEIWWDDDLRAGDGISSKIEDAIERATLVVVIWTERSVKSHWVRAEAGRALKKKKLIPVRFELVEQPMPFDGIHCDDLLDWDGDEGIESFLDFVKVLHERTATVPPPSLPRDGRRRVLTISLGVAGAIATLAAAAAAMSNYLATNVQKPDAGSEQATAAGGTAAAAGGSPHTSSAGAPPVKPPDAEGGRGGAPQPGGNPPLTCCHTSGSVKTCYKASCAACGYRECGR